MKTETLPAHSQMVATQEQPSDDTTPANPNLTERIAVTEPPKHDEVAPGPANTSSYTALENLLDPTSLIEEIRLLVREEIRRLQPNPSTSIPPLAGSIQPHTSNHSGKKANITANDRLADYPQLNSKPRRKRTLTFRPDTNQSGTDGEQSRAGTPNTSRSEYSWSLVVSRKDRGRRGTPAMPRPLASRARTQLRGSPIHR